MFEKNNYLSGTTIERENRVHNGIPQIIKSRTARASVILLDTSDISEPDFTPALTLTEMKFLRSTLYLPNDQDLFRPYYILEKILRQFVYWIDHYEHIYYHGLFRDLSVIQTPDYDIRIYHLLKSQAVIDEQEIEKARKQYTQTLIPIITILIPNWNGMIAYPLKELYKYSFRLEKIQELMDFDFSCLMPDMKHHEIEAKELQRYARVFRDNIENYVNKSSSGRR